MSVTMRRLLGVGIALLALAGGTVTFSSQREQKLDAARVQAQAELDAELPKVAASVTQLSNDVAKAAERGANLPGFSALLSEITTQSDVKLLADTFHDFESEPWFSPFVSVGPHAIFLGETLLHSDHPELGRLAAPLVASANAHGTATGVMRAEGGTWFVGVGRSVQTTPQQQALIFVLARAVAAEQLAPLANTHGVALLLVPDGKVSEAKGAGDAADLEQLKQRVTSMKAAPEPCCAMQELAPGVRLHVYRDSAPKLVVAASDASGMAVPIFGLAGLLALGGLVFGLRAPRAVDEESARLLRETAAQLKLSQEQLQRLSQHISSNAPATQAALGQSAAPPETGLESTQASAQKSRYEVVAPLGEGGMARVSVAVVRGAEGFKRTFVVKRLRPELANNQEVVNQFIDEARLGASLVHSNIVPVFDFGRDADGYFLAQEYILGRDVDALSTASLERRGRPLSPAEAACIGIEGLKALSYAHTRTNDAGRPMGLVHRDVSPNNLMVSARGEVKLLDFGIVKSDERATKTQAGVVKGNLFFMSPEQARALPVDARSDLFSMGMVLVSALTGSPLYEGNNVYDLMNRAGAGLTDADRERVRRGCGVLSEVVLKALSTDPAARYANALEFAAALAATTPAASSAELQAVMESLFAQAFAEERQRFAVTA